MAAESPKIGGENRISSIDVYKALGFQPLQEAYKWMSIIKHNKAKAAKVECIYG